MSILSLARRRAGLVATVVAVAVAAGVWNASHRVDRARRDALAKGLALRLRLLDDASVALAARRRLDPMRLSSIRSDVDLLLAEVERAPLATDSACTTRALRAFLLATQAQLRQRDETDANWAAAARPTLQDMMGAYLGMQAQALRSYSRQLGVATSDSAMSREPIGLSDERIAQMQAIATQANHVGLLAANAGATFDLAMGREPERRAVGWNAPDREYEVVGFVPDAVAAPCAPTVSRPREP